MTSTRKWNKRPFVMEYKARMYDRDVLGLYYVPNECRDCPYLKWQIALIHKVHHLLVERKPVPQ